MLLSHRLRFLIGTFGGVQSVSDSGPAAGVVIVRSFMMCCFFHVLPHVRCALTIESPLFRADQDARVTQVGGRSGWCQSGASRDHCCVPYAVWCVCWFQQLLVHLLQGEIMMSVIGRRSSRDVPFGHDRQDCVRQVPSRLWWSQVC
jgi:hypothetical protein